MAWGVTMASTLKTSTSPMRTEFSRMRHPCATPLAVFMRTGWPVWYSSPMRSASGLPMATVVAPVSTMNCITRPLIRPWFTKWPRLSLMRTILRPPPARAPTLTGASPRRTVLRVPLISITASSRPTESTLTPWWVSPAATPRGADPSTTSRALLPRTPASETACAQAAPGAHKAPVSNTASRAGRGEAMDRAQSRKLLNDSGMSVMSLRISAMAACRSSRLAPVTRTFSSWMAACTLSLLSLRRRCSFLPSSASMPLRTLITCLTLSPPIFCGLPMSRKRTSTLRLVSLLRSRSSTWVSWNSASPNRVISLSLSSTAAEVPLKSKRVPISLAAFSTAFFTSTKSASQTVSKAGGGGSSPKSGAAPGPGATIREMLVEKNASLQPYNTFGIVARAETLVRVRSVEDLEAFRADPVRGQAPVFVLGGGSNVVLTGDVSGVVLKVEIRGRRLVQETPGAWIVEVGEGEPWHELVAWTLAQGWPGLENMALIPGTVGAAPVQNIGAYGLELQDRFESLDAVDLVTGRSVTLGPQICAFAYRDSVFKHSLAGRTLITRVRLRLPRPWQPVLGYLDIERRMRERS